MLVMHDDNDALAGGDVGEVGLDVLKDLHRRPASVIERLDVPRAERVSELADKGGVLGRHGSERWPEDLQIRVRSPQAVVHPFLIGQEVVEDLLAVLPDEIGMIVAVRLDAMPLIEDHLQEAARIGTGRRIDRRRHVERRLDVVFLQGGQDVGRTLQMRAVVEGQRDEFPRAA